MNYQHFVMNAAVSAFLLSGVVGCHAEPVVAVDDGATLLASAECLDSEPATCPGALVPRFELADFQPQSTRFEQLYGLDEFHGNVTLVALLASW